MKLSQRHRLVNRMLTIRQPFFAKAGHASVGRTREDDVYGGMFLTQKEAIDDPHIGPLHGKQNSRRGTLSKHKRKIAHEYRRRNRGR